MANDNIFNIPENIFLRRENYLLGDSSLSKFQQSVLNADIVPQNIIKDVQMPEIPTFEERIVPVTDRMDSMQQELKTQTSALQKLRYENTKLNAQVKVLNKTNDKQLSKISDLKAADTISKNTIFELNKEVKNIRTSNKWATLKGIFIGVVGTVIGGLILNYISSIT